MKELTLKINDEVLQYSYGRVKREVITAITPAGNFKVGNTTYNKDGCLRGSANSFSRYDSRIEPFDAEKWQTIKQEAEDIRIRRAVKDAIDTGIVTKEMYRVIVAIIYPPKQVGV